MSSCMWQVESVHLPPSLIGLTQNVTYPTHNDYNNNYSFSFFHLCSLFHLSLRAPSIIVDLLSVHSRFHSILYFFFFMSCCLLLFDVPEAFYLSLFNTYISFLCSLPFLFYVSPVFSSYVPPILLQLTSGVSFLFHIFRLFLSLFLPPSARFNLLIFLSLFLFVLIS